MFGKTFYHQHLHNYTIVFGTIFNDVNVERRETDGTLKQTMKVPLVYGPRDKFLVRVHEAPDAHKEVSITLPMMSFQITDFSYDASRKLNTMHKSRQAHTREADKTVFNPVPWNITFELSILAKYMHDANMILEQILPFFGPKYVVTTKTFPQLDLKHDIPIDLVSVSLNDSYEDDWTTRREIIYTLNFVMRAVFYGPDTTTPLITKVLVDTLVPNGDFNDPAVLAATPRTLRATVEPTPPTATRLDDFGYTETLESFTDNKKYNPVTGQDEDI